MKIRIRQVASFWYTLETVLCGRDLGLGAKYMTAIWIAIVVTLLTFAGGALGLYLQRMLPDEHSVEKSRDMIGSVMGLVTLLLALVLGTIVGSAYFFSATQQSELQALSAQAIQLDEALAQFGPEAKPLRDKWKENLDKSLKLFWGGGDVDPAELHVAKAMTATQAFKGAIRSLDANDWHRERGRDRRVGPRLHRLSEGDQTFAVVNFVFPRRHQPAVRLRGAGTPLARTALSAAALLWAGKLSMMTMSPGLRVGTSWVST
jgi:hypothetical protein